MQNLKPGRRGHLLRMQPRCVTIDAVSLQKALKGNERQRGCGAHGEQTHRCAIDEQHSANHRNDDHRRSKVTFCKDKQHHENAHRHDRDK